LANKTIISAKLKLYVYASAQGQSFYINKVANNSWTETSITWNNQLTMGDTIYTGSTGEAINSWHVYQSDGIKAYVDACKGGSMSVGFNGSENELSYNFYRDKEHSAGSLKPQLIVEYAE
jgi:hypothetical protein